MPTDAPLSRRTFLTTTTLAAGAAALSARSHAQVAGANNRLRMGFIGCGNIGDEHLVGLLKIKEEENLDIVAICDVYLKRAEDFAGRVEKAGAAKPLVTQRYQDILAMKDIDYVLIATPEHSHAYLTLEALAAGKHVYVEKPVTHTIEEAIAVLAKTRETGLKVQVGVQGMADDSYSSAHEAIRAGKLGKVVQAQIDYVRNYQELGPWRKEVVPSGRPSDLDWETWLRPAPEREFDAHRYLEWRCYQDYSGGIATDLFIHRLTRIIRACGLEFPSRVCGMGGIYTWNDGRDLPDSMEMIAEYQAIEGITNGMTVHVLGTMANDDENAHCIRGTDATLTFTKTGWEIKADDKKGDIIATHTKTGGEDVKPHHKNHHAAIRSNAPLNCPVELGLYGLAAVRMANLSHFDRRVYGWDTEKQNAVAL
jgi:predicted dehydrogenase